jgi:hypothetical protein
MRCIRDHLDRWILGKLCAAAKPVAGLRIWRIRAVHDAVGPSINHQSVDPCLVQIGARKKAMPTKNRFTYTLTILNIAFLTFGEMSCTSSPPPNPQNAEQQIPLTNAKRAEQQIALLQKARTQELEYLKELEKTIREEKRNEAWAAQKETELRKSFSAEKGLQNGVLKSVECRSSKCDLQFQVSLERKGSVEQLAAINHWIAATQACGYTITPWPNPEQLSGEIRVFLNCGEQ